MTTPTSALPLTYPTPPTSDQVDDYHGTSIADPYRPLEDSDAPATRAWIEAQNALTSSVLDRHEGREAIRDRLTELWDYPRSGAPWRRGDRWFQHRNTGLQDQDVLWTADAPEAEGTVLFDANQLSEEGTTALSDVAVSDSGAFVALGLSHAGSDWRRWRVRRVSTGEELPDRVEWSKFASAAWTPDDAGFFYGRYPQPPADAAYDAPNLNMEVRYHRLGTDSAGDTLVFATPDCRTGAGARRVRRRPPPGAHRVAEAPTRRTGPMSPTSPTASRPRSCGRCSTRAMPATSTSRHSTGRSTC